MLSLIAAAGVALVGGCATASLSSGWAPTAVTANGSADDWADKQICTTMRNGLQLTVANDAERLYVMAKFRANDQQWSRAASRGGLTLQVVGPRKRTMSFRLPQGPERVPGREGEAWDTIRNPRADFGHVPAPAEFAGKLIVVDVDKNVVPVEPDGSKGPAAGFSSENGMCVYEFSVPFEDTILGHFSLGAGVGTGLNLTVTAGPDAATRRAMQGEMRPQGPPEGGGGFGGGGQRGMGGRGGFGGGPGRGGPQGGPPGGQMAANPSLSVAVRLATVP